MTNHVLFSMTLNGRIAADVGPISVVSESMRGAVAALRSKGIVLENPDNRTLHTHVPYSWHWARFA